LRDHEHIELISSGGATLAYVIRGSFAPDRTIFPTPSDLNLQVGYVVYPAGGEVQRHTHTPVQRSISGTSEVIVVREGRCALDVYDDARELVATRELAPGDVMLMVGGGHGFRMLEPTTLLEIKQGPYGGEDEKVRF
jgi:quercetin dioxygenase-like cupin family protein